MTWVDVGYNALKIKQAANFMKLNHKLGVERAPIVMTRL